MAQKHNTDFTEKPMTTYGRTQGPSRRYRRLRNPTFPAAEWTAKNPLLQRGEIGVESDTHKVKVGDGLTYWNSLQYITSDGGAVDSVNGHTGVVVLTASDVGALPDSTSLSGLSDVTLTTPSSGQVLSYDGSKWVNETKYAMQIVDYTA